MKIIEEILIHAIILVLWFIAFQIGLIDRITWSGCMFGYGFSFIIIEAWQMKLTDFQEIDFEKWEKENE